MGAFEQTFLKNQYDVKQAAQKSQTWFQQQARLLAKQTISPQTLIRADSKRNKAKITPGEMYLFAYDAKTQDTLPYWDMFPLVFPFRRLPDGFIGLNFHYLPYMYRIKLLDRLLEFKTSKTLTETTKLRYSWSTIASATKYKWAQPCVHRYLTAHVQSAFKKIDAPDWGTAMMLPVERFVGANKLKIWSASLK